jgi:hypothetical protein
VLLKSTASLTGLVSVVDSAGNVYVIDRDVNDASASDRLLTISSLNAKALSTGSTIKLSFPSSAEYHISADEFAGLTGLDTGAGAWATSTTFNSGLTSTTRQANELLFGEVGIESGSAPVWAIGWTALPVLSVASDYQDVAYEAVTATGQYAASGTTSGTWMAGITAYTGSTTVAMAQMRSASASMAATGLPLPLLLLLGALPIAGVLARGFSQRRVVRSTRGFNRPSD